jgi:Zn-dependent peptidase ImmA (M78 family)/transcriptional regulator with XRE-family HTH domain
VGSFNAAMMIVARQARGFSQTKLAKALRVSQSKISKIEAGFVPPDDALIDTLAETLHFRRQFFMRDAQLRSPPTIYHRKKQKLSVGDWDRILAQSDIYRLCIETMLRSVELVPSKPAPPMIDPDQYDGRVDQVAYAVRQAWMLPRGPVVDVAKAIEDSGVMIIPFDFGTDLIDAFCQHGLDRLPPLIFLNARLKAKDRLRFSLAHELGHLVMHALPRPEQEEQANEFAAAFLMPADDIRASLYSMSLERLMVLKKYWKTSMQAVLRRARDLKRVSDRGYRYYQIEMSKRGWRSAEPIDIDGPIESPKVFANLISSHITELGYAHDELAELFGLFPEDMPEAAQAERPRLRLVTN